MTDRHDINLIYGCINLDLTLRESDMAVGWLYLSCHIKRIDLSDECRNVCMYRKLIVDLLIESAPLKHKKSWGLAPVVFHSVDLFKPFCSDLSQWIPRKTMCTTNLVYTIHSNREASSTFWGLSKKFWRICRPPFGGCWNVYTSLKWSPKWYLTSAPRSFKKKACNS